MRFAPVVLALSTLLVSASASLNVRQSVPSCVTTCLASANTGGCSSTDYTCLCENQSFISTMLSCMDSTCSPSDLASAESLAAAFCLSEGVTVSIPTVTPTATSPTSTSTSTTTASAASIASTGAATSNGVNALTGFAIAFALAAVV